MVAIVHQCPHCLAERMSFAVVGQASAPVIAGRSFRNFVYLQCRGCGLPSAAEIGDGSNHQVGDLRTYPFGLEQMGYRVLGIWPEVPQPRAPPHLPDVVARAFSTGERAFVQRGMEDASAAAYGRALEIATKLYAPDLESLTLYRRIEGLAASHRITADLASWAHAIRTIRNDALHEVESITRDELVAIRGFTELVLTYLFALPGMLRDRQAGTSVRPET